MVVVVEFKQRIVVVVVVVVMVEFKQRIVVVVVVEFKQYKSDGL